MKFKLILKNNNVYNSIKEINNEKNICNLCNGVECNSTEDVCFCFAGIKQIILESEVI
ncbi:MAG: hypothetical protein PVG30_02365 [Gammaproteobacteria bacterium]|jgi:hypothetical protein